MLSQIVRFEVRYHARQPAFRAAVPLFFLLGLGLGATRFGPDNVALNSPYLVMEGAGLISLVGLIVAGIFAASAVLRDDDHRMSEIVHATPVPTFPFLLGRFAGVFLATLVTVGASALGMAAALLLPGVPAERIAAFDARPYLAAFGVVTVPNVLFAAALLFAVAAWTRNALATHAAAVSLYGLYFVCAALTGSPLMAGSRPGGGAGMLPSLLDPFALTSFFDLTRHWTAVEKNARFIPLAGGLLLNRLLWTATAVVLLAAVYRSFTFRTRAAKPRKPEPVPPVVARRWESRPIVRPAGDSWLAAWRSCAGIEIRALFTRSTLLLFGLWLAWALSEIYGGVLAGEYGSTVYPATGLLIQALETPATILGLILILYYGGELFWREQRYRMAAIADGTPVSGTVRIAAKWTALAALLGAFLLGGVAVCIAVQLSRGWLDFQPALYLAFFYFTGVPLLLYAAAALFLQALSPGKYAGMLAFLLFVIVSRRAASLGLEHDLWRFASAPPVSFSELGGFGAAAGPFHAFMLHWTVLALLLAMTAAGLWRRLGAPWGERLRALGRPGFAARGLVGIFILTGGWIFYQTNIANAYVTADEMAGWRADYEKVYKRIETLPRPRICAVDGQVDLDPGARRFRVAGRYGLVNETSGSIASVYVARRREGRVNALSVSGARLAARDGRFGMDRFDFQPPLAPGARAELRFDLSFEPRGFGSGQLDDSVAENGTFLMNLRGFPTLGYRGSYELADPRERRKRGLRGESAAVLDEDGERRAVDASVDDWIGLRLTVTTAADQTAVAPGRLESTWSRNGRRGFVYRTEAPVLNRFAIASGRYAVAKRQHGPVSLEVYYDPAHGANVQRMLDAVAASLDVLQASYGPYPHRELRIIEAPATLPMAGYALPGTIYIREDAGFLTDTRDSDRPDLIARRIAHEVAHQWFGHRLHTANEEGATLLVESLAKDSELRVVERLRGPEQVRRFLEIELDRYLSGRAAETASEVPLARVDRQPYLFYSKAAVVLHALRGILGPERFESAVRALMREPHPTSAAFVRHLRAGADSRQSELIDQWLNGIVLYDLRVASAQTQKRADGRWDVILEVEAGKSRADGQGNEQPLPFAEPIEIAVTAEGKVLDSRQHELKGGTNEIRLIVGFRPADVTVDPGITRIDRNPLDNAKEL